jgi:predicted RNA-binding Zn-ribbon protein involved in translation (DUF1610 family)
VASPFTLFEYDEVRSVVSRRLSLITALRTGVTFQDVSTSEKDGDHDACPSCGTRVESAISAPSEPLRESTRRRCPNCGKVLLREVGGTWAIDESASS